MTVDEAEGVVRGVLTKIAAGQFDITMHVGQVKKGGTVTGYQDFPG